MLPNMEENDLELCVALFSQIKINTFCWLEDPQCTQTP